MYHQEMIPTQLLLSVIASKQDVPFSTALELIGMLSLPLSFLQEAGLRLPDPIGDTVSIIGAHRRPVGGRGKGHIAHRRDRRRHGTA